VAHLGLVGLPNVVAATAGGLMGACIGVGALLGGWAIDRWGAGRLGLVGALLLATGVAALISTAPASFWLAAIYVLAGGIGRGIIGVNLATVQARAFAGPALGRVSGLLDLGFGFGAFAGPYLTALSRDLTGSYNAGLATALLAGLLAAVFLAAGSMKLTQERRKLLANPNLKWVEDFSAGTIKLIGTAEVLGALGLILPGALDIAPVLVPLAATGIAVIMIGAIITHARRKEPQAIGFNAILLIVAAVIMWGRFGPYSF
jgi:MFS family permease